MNKLCVSVNYFTKDIHLLSEERKIWLPVPEKLVLPKPKPLRVGLSGSSPPEFPMASDNVHKPNAFEENMQCGPSS